MTDNERAERMFVLRVARLRHEPPPPAWLKNPDTRECVWEVVNAGKYGMRPSRFPKEA
jgi:hypothetical protein